MQKVASQHFSLIIDVSKSLPLPSSLKSIQNIFFKKSLLLRKENHRHIG